MTTSTPTSARTPSKARPPLRRAKVLAPALLTAALGVGLPVLVQPASAQAASNGYVALGDSYSSGEGTRDYFKDGTSCDRSAKSYGALIASQKGYSLTLAACSGATTGDVTSQQLSSLKSDTALVTMTIGGNDVGFADIITECAKPGWWGDCTKKVDGALSVVNGQMSGRLGALYAKIRSASPKAKVVVSGYPHLFNGKDCNIATFFTSEEMSKLNAATDTFNGVIKKAATDAGFSYVDPVGAFTGHATCDKAAWINNLTMPVAASFHPNVDGHRSGYAPVFSASITKAASAKSAATTSVQLPAATGRPETVQTPDLTSPDAKAAAKRAGISQNDLQQMTRAQQQGASNASLDQMNRSAEQRAGR